MPIPSEFRRRFKEYTGAETYAKFVKALHRTQGKDSRLRFWQQDLWQSFVSDNPDFELSEDVLVDALRICEQHEDELFPKEIPVFHGCIDYNPEYLQDMAARFPHATMEQIMVSPNHTRPTCTMWVCPTCDEILNASKWKQR